MMTPRFALNRTCAPQKTLGDFIALAKAAGAGAVEIRNDIEGREFQDGTPAEDVAALLMEAGLRVASVNALQRFNDWNLDREREAAALIGYAARLGAPGVVLCPVHHADHGWSVADAEKKLRDGLRCLMPILRDAGVAGYVEPLGMRASTMKRQDMAIGAIGDVDGFAHYQLCYDTFQFFRCGDTVLHAERIGLVHISGITRTDLGPGDLTEPDRVLVEERDRVGNIAQLRVLREAGYGGWVSMEPFNADVQQMPDLAVRARASFKRVSEGLA